MERIGVDPGVHGHHRRFEISKEHKRVGQGKEIPREPRSSRIASKWINGSPNMAKSNDKQGLYHQSKSQEIISKSTTNLMPSLFFFIDKTYKILNQRITFIYSTSFLSIVTVPLNSINLVLNMMCL